MYSSSVSVRRLIAVVLVTCSGCCCHEWQHLPDDCAHAFHCTHLGRVVHDVVCQDLCCDCGEACDACCCGDVCDGMEVCDDVVVLDEPCCVRECRPRIKVGPPPERYRPPMPPMFLPVPACSVFSPVNMGAPTLAEGQVEVGYGHQLAFPAGD